MGEGKRRHTADANANSPIVTAPKTDKASKDPTKGVKINELRSTIPLADLLAHSIIR